MRKMVSQKGEAHVRRRGRGHRVVSGALAVVFAATTSGCGTLISGTKQDVVVAMTPGGSTLDVYHWNGERLTEPVSSPTTAVMQRPKGSQKSRLAVASMPGYCPRYWVTTSRPSAGAWTYLWMVFWPALGPLLVVATNGAVDNATGGCCAMSPDVYDVALEPEAACPESLSD